MENITCNNTPRWDHLGTATRIQHEGALDYSTARRIADREASKLCEDPMLLAWYEAGSGDFSPRVE